MANSIGVKGGEWGWNPYTGGTAPSTPVPHLSEKRYILLPNLRVRDPLLTQASLHSAHSGLQTGLQHGFHTNKQLPKQLPDLSDRGRPLRRTGSSDRGPCSSQLIALVPGADRIDLQAQTCVPSDAAPALTVAATPILWFYVPAHYLTSSPLRLELDVWQADGTAVVNGVEITEPIDQGLKRAGIVGVRLPYELQPNQQYRWMLELLVDADRPDRNPVIGGDIQTLVSLAEAPSMSSVALSLDRAMFYRDQQIWYDALSTLAQLRSTHPDDPAVTQAWSVLLESVGLGAIAPAPVIHVPDHPPLP